MARSLALLAGLVAAVAAQTTTVNFLLPLYDRQALEGSVVGVKDGATTIAIHCPKGTDSDECGIAGTDTVVGGPSTMHLTYSMPADPEYDVGEAKQDYGCVLDPKNDRATCSVTQIEILSGSTKTTKMTTAQNGYKTFLQAITVTAGVDKLSGDDDDDTSAAPGASATDSEPTSASKPKATDAQATESTDATPSSDAAATPVNSDNAAGPAVTQNAVLAVAAVVGGAAMLL
ncbi:hypothetical protein FSARC_8337 [Fusarium sarcochroum]|uniref:GPI anchored protein n=1 Tax=Fusarium sarcochroum TaxID=1208366 RepID=A0A8H4X6H3_9HYPO|nr:hypothetical protein FSARC_8337 [Fusarium sarcochroum]